MKAALKVVVAAFNVQTLPSGPCKDQVASQQTPAQPVNRTESPLSPQSLIGHSTRGLFSCVLSMQLFTCVLSIRSLTL